MTRTTSVTSEEPPRRSTPDDPPARPTRRCLSAAVAETIVVAAVGGVAFLHARTAFHFLNDDLWQFAVVREEGLSWELLGFNLFGHFAPVNRFAHLALLEWGDADLTLGAAVAAGLVSLLALTVLWVCHELRLPPVRRVLVVALTGFSIAVLDSAIWMDTAVHILLALIATYAVLAAHLRALNRRSGRWHAGSVLLFALGLLVQERPAFALPLIVLTDLLLVTAGRPWRQRLRVLGEAAVPLAAMTAIAAVAAVLLRTFYAWGDTTPSLTTVGRVLSGVGTGVLFPALAGHAPEQLPSATAQLVVAGLLAAAAVLLVARRRTNASPLLYLVLAFLLYYGFLVFSPILFDANAEWTALRLHNVAYVVVPTLLAMAHLQFGRTRPAGEVSATGRPATPRRAVVPAVLTVAAVVATGAVHADRKWAGPRQAHAYLQEVLDGRGQWTRPDVTVLPLRAPASVATVWAADRGRHEALLPLFEPGWEPQPPRGRFVVLDDRGRVRPVSLREEARVIRPDGAACLSTSAGADSFTYSLPAPVEGPTLFALVHYDLVGGAATTIAAAGDGDDHWTPTPWPVELTAGESIAVLPLEGRSVSAVALWHLSHDVAICARELRVVRPVYREGTACEAIGQYGAPAGPVSCRRVERVPTGADAGATEGGPSGDGRTGGGGR
ncbi:hypothetical protein ACI782_04365 [Geodermatophilus sp. SYSU D00703]